MAGRTRSDGRTGKIALPRERERERERRSRRRHENGRSLARMVIRFYSKREFTLQFNQARYRSILERESRACLFTIGTTLSDYVPNWGRRSVSLALSLIEERVFFRDRAHPSATACIRRLSFVDFVSIPRSLAWMSRAPDLRLKPFLNDEQSRG